MALQATGPWPPTDRAAGEPIGDGAGTPMPMDMAGAAVAGAGVAAAAGASGALSGICWNMLCCARAEPAASRRPSAPSTAGAVFDDMSPCDVRFDMTLVSLSTAAPVGLVPSEGGSGCPIGPALPAPGPPERPSQP